MKLTLYLVAISMFVATLLQSQNAISINLSDSASTISPHIYGQFSEHLGRGIYEGIWVGRDSKIPNTRGVRNDVLNALKKIKVPNLRWPGGCFADEYHWEDGIGNDRPTMINTHWGGVVEDNSFGTHEFLDLCAMLETEPYICGNVGSGTVEEMSDWVEYLNFDGVSPMAKLRKVNGREDGWGVTYWGVGNESWGCGGNMRPEYYADLYSRYATYCRNYGPNKLYKIAGGSSNDDYNWTEVLLKNVKHHLMDGISIHYYTINRDWSDKHSATDFDEESYFYVIEKSLKLDTYITGHKQVMDKYDPQNKIALIVDEWGTWHHEEPGSKAGFLYQQNTLRDAMVAAVSLNIFHKHSDRVHMANIAQTVNVLQAMILTDNEKMVLTPTYHVFDMYQAHMGATHIPLQMTSEKYNYNYQSMDAVYATASRAKNGEVTISLTNIDPHHEQEINLAGIKGKVLKSQLLTATQINSYNSFDRPDEVQLVPFNNYKFSDDGISIRLPSKSIVSLKINPN